MWDFIKQMGLWLILHLCQKCTMRSRLLLWGPLSYLSHLHVKSMWALEPKAKEFGQLHKANWHLFPVQLSRSGCGVTTSPVVDHAWEAGCIFFIGLSLKELAGWHQSGLQPQMRWDSQMWCGQQSVLIWRTKSRHTFPSQNTASPRPATMGSGPFLCMRDCICCWMTSNLVGSWNNICCARVYCIHPREPPKMIILFRFLAHSTESPLWIVGSYVGWSLWSP